MLLASCLSVPRPGQPRETHLVKRCELLLLGFRECLAQPGDGSRVLRRARSMDAPIDGYGFHRDIENPSQSGTQCF